MSRTFDTSQAIADSLTKLKAPVWAVKTGAYTAVHTDAIHADTSGGAFTVTLPSTPAVGDYVDIADFAGTFADFNLTVDGNGANIMGGATPFILDRSNISIRLVYTGASQGWRMV